jgi:hypothetical protein
MRTTIRTMTTTRTIDMEDVTTPVISGIVVLLAGLLAFIVVVGGEAEVPGPGVIVTPAGATSHSDLDPVLERVLISSGDAWVYQADVQAELPAELVRVLDAYQASLMIPAGEWP